MTQTGRVLVDAHQIGDAASIDDPPQIVEDRGVVRTSVRRIAFAMASSYPYQRDFARAHAELINAAAR